MDGQRVLTFPLSRVNDDDIKSALIWLNWSFESDPFTFSREYHEDYGAVFAATNSKYSIVGTTRRELLAYIDGLGIGMKWKGDE